MPTPEATPLLTDLQRLPLQTEPTQAHDSAPISARVSHSAFGLPRQQALVIIRGGILAYLTGLGPVVVRSKLTESAAVRETPWSIIFDFTTASLILQWLWYFVTFLWSLRQLQQATNDDDDDQHWLTRAIANVAPADQAEPSTGHIASNLLYNTAHVFNFMNTLMYWTVLVPRGHFGTGWFALLCTANIYGATTLIAMNEVMFLNTIKHQQDASSHVLSVMLFLVGYLGRAAIGHAMTGRYAFFWMDPEEMGSARLVAACASGFVGMGAVAFAALHGLTSLREKLANHDSREDGYTRIQDSDEEDGQSQTQHE